MHVKLEHGSGGALSHRLTSEVIFPFFRGQTYRELSDSSLCTVSAEILVTTDSYVVDPLFFPGGDIGRLAVFGTCNDLAVGGGKPRFLTLGLIAEEGLPLSQLKRVLASVAGAATSAEVEVISGDTKVVPAGKGGGLYVNTAGIADRVFQLPLTRSNVRETDAVIVSGPVGAHGIAVLSARESLSVGRQIESDLASLSALCGTLFPLGNRLRFLRDATRGGVAAVLNELVHNTGLGLEVSEQHFPVSPKVAAVADLLGLQPLEIANEGVIVAVVAQEAASEAVKRMRSDSHGKQAAIVGQVTSTRPGTVVLETLIGGRRILDFPQGLLLPRIC